MLKQKLLVLVAICPKGLSEPYFVPSIQAINQDIYQERCINQRLLSIISKYNKRNLSSIFWLDPASSHFEKSVLEMLKFKKIQFLPIDLNLSNTPQTRAFENIGGPAK